MYVGESEGGRSEAEGQTWSEGSRDIQTGRVVEDPASDSKAVTRLAPHPLLSRCCALLPPPLTLTPLCAPSSPPLSSHSSATPPPWSRRPGSSCWPRRPRQRGEAGAPAARSTPPCCSVWLRSWRGAAGTTAASASRPSRSPASHDVATSSAGGEWGAKVPICLCVGGIHTS